MSQTWNDWKRILVVCVLAVLLAGVSAAFADVHAANIASGKSGTCKWVIDANGTLTISPESGTTGTMGNWEGTDDERPPWVRLGYNDRVKAVRATGTIKLPTCMDLFMCLENATSIDLRGFDSSGATSMFAMFDRCSSITSIDLSPLDTSSVTDMSFLFSDCDKLTSVNWNGVDASKVKTMHRMFCDCDSLTAMNLTMLRTPSLTDVSEMFGWCDNLKSVNLSTFDTSKVTNFTGMFCVTGLTSLDLSWMNTSSARTMEWMFGDSRELQHVNVSSFNTSRVTNMRCMFDNCFALTELDISNFNVSNVTNMEAMLYDLRELQTLKLPDWNIGKVPADLRAGFPCDMEDLTTGDCFAIDSTIPARSARTYKRDYYPGMESSFSYKYFGSYGEYKKHLSKKLNRVYKKIKGSIDSGAEYPIPGLVTTYVRGTGNVQAYNSYIPQGICKAGDYILITAYDGNENAKSVIYVLNQDASYLESTITLPHKYHVGGIAFDGSKVWLTGNTSDKYLKNNRPFVQYFSYAKLQEKAGSNVAKLNSNELSVQIPIKNKPSFLECASGKLWVGTYITNNATNKGYIYGYPIRNAEGTGRLNTDVYTSIVGIPSSAQGMDIVGNDLYVSSSYKGTDKSAKSSHITKYGISAALNNACMNVNGKGKAVEVPKMNEEILVQGGLIYIVFESASETWKKAVVNTDRVLPVKTGLWG